jgi:drug/metabolite transporter (DMT)-like permease
MGTETERKDVTSMSQRKGLLCVFVAAALFSLGGLCVKMIPWQALSINSFRSIISVCILLIFAKVSGHKLVLTRGVAIGAVCVCGTTTLYTMANKLTTAANTILLQFTAPAFIILFLWLAFQEKPKKGDMIACVLVFAGIACFFLDSLGGGTTLGNLLAVASGAFYAWVFLLNKLPGGDALFSCILGQGLGALIGLPSLVQETDFSATALTFALILGVFQLGIAYVFFTAGIAYAPPVSASLVSGIEPILNPLLVAVVLGETITGLSLVGGAVVFVTIMVYNVLSARQEAREAASAET